MNATSIGLGIVVGVAPGDLKYRLTDAGRDLFGAIVALMRWGDEHLPHPNSPPVVLRHDACGEIADPRLRYLHRLVRAALDDAVEEELLARNEMLMKKKTGQSLWL